MRFLDGGGAVAQLLRDRDWTGHPLGAPCDWPAALKSSVSLCLRSAFPGAIYWGPDYILLYNDAWIEIADRHPAQLGLPAAQARADIWPVLAPQFAAAMASGEGVVSSAQRLMMQRAGVPTETYWTYAITPIQDAHGVTCGIFGQGIDVTAQILSERALRKSKAERDFVLTLVERQRTHSDPDDVMQVSAEAVGAYLGVDRSGFFEVTPDGMIDYGACWISGALPPLTGSMPSALFGKRMGATVGRGATLVFATPDDPAAPDGAALSAVGTQAGVSVPLVRGGAWQGAFYVSQAVPRAWTGDEIALIEEVAELSWDAVARVRATARLRAHAIDLTDTVAARTAERDQLWNVSNDLLGIADREGHWLSVNPAWERLLGWTQAEVLGRGTQWIRHPEDTGGSAAEIARIAASGVTHQLEKRLRTRDGSYRTFAWQTTLVGNRLYTNARDVTEERRQQAAVRAADARTRMVLEAMEGVGVWTYDVAQDRFASESGFGAIYGFSSAQMDEGVSLADLAARVHPDDLPILRGAIDHAQATGRDGAHEYRLLLPDGTLRWVMARNHVLHDLAGKPETVVGVVVDVSRQRELEDRLRQSQKMEAVGQLTGGLAHDFNNLLTGMSGALELMQLRLQQRRLDDLPRYIGAAQAGVARAAALTHRLLAFSRRQPLDPRPVDVPQLIAGMTDLLRGTLGPAITLDIATDATSWAVLVDGNQLENALLNLCINARDASPAGSTVRIATHNATLDAEAAAASELAAGEYLVLSVTDTGTGMSPDVIARAFDPFFTTKPIGQGTGLGLSMIYGFVRQSGGAVQIRSAPGAGTTMALFLPRTALAAAVPRAAGAGLAALDRAAAGRVGATVLIVDDEPAVRMMLREGLSELGYRVDEAETGAGALDHLATAGQIDLLITDVGLPGGMNGRQVADAARRLRPDLPILFITGFAETAVFGDGPRDSGTALLAKPFAIETLATRIRALLDA
ncbi:PAS domain-containing protein [Sphingomonas sp. RB3P16]|uniref:PAS domain-containing protein n=1 Tax=Parasphingomonas frigoris TaxID=3096163 RepID=UPI002FC8205D